MQKPLFNNIRYYLANSKFKYKIFIFSSLLFLITSCADPGDGISLREPLSVEFFAGSTLGFADGLGSAARFSSLFGIAAEPKGTVYVSDINNHRIRMITPSGLVRTLAGSATQGFTDGQGAAAQFYGPVGIAVGPNGNIYVVDSRNHRIRMITPSGLVSTLAGSTFGFTDGQGTTAQFDRPSGIAVGADGNIYVADTNNDRIRKITPSGLVSVLAGSTFGFADGQGTTAQFKAPFGIAVGPNGNIYVVGLSQRIRKITPSGLVSTLAGSGTAGFADGQGTAAQFKDPGGITMGPDGYIYVTDTGNKRIRRISLEGEVFTIIRLLETPNQIVLTADGVTGYITTNELRIFRIRFR